ncbi:MAG TPA: tRNA uridine-5-carboxymethylaminomethyl(34) synthesis GTPase MnmE [Rhodothermales bacterium]|nr:tRNA uridine-5-carboxymethylaminomethyl(34) synthesis GTPase MnmE [Rhodothermales bacterium]
MANDTIAAIATARGVAALAIVRVSGPKAIEIAGACFRGADLSAVASHTVHVGSFEAASGQDVDQVVVTVFRAPHSVTGEDVVEVSCHGGDFTQQEVLRSLLDRGARLAEPGEFTQRAFLNGKIDLAQAEAVADLIHAHSSLAQRVSLAQLHGRYSRHIEDVRAKLLETCSLIELELDFSEEDVEFADWVRLARLLDETSEFLQRLLGSAHLGTLIRDGVRVVIGGRPNAGKSTLLNALLGTDRAIVSDIPGTTRDEIEAETEIEGLRFRFVDTAGLREASDVIEAEGVRRTHRAIQRSQMLLYVHDLTKGLDADETRFLEDIGRSHPELDVIRIGNKADLAARPADVGGDELLISALQAQEDADALVELRRLLVERARGGFSESDASQIVTNERHRQHLQRAADAIRDARAHIDSASGDVLSIDLRRALNELGSITGEVTTEDILGEIFSRFCIGK